MYNITRQFLFALIITNAMLKFNLSITMDLSGVNFKKLLKIEFFCFKVSLLISSACYLIFEGELSKLYGDIISAAHPYIYISGDLVI